MSQREIVIMMENAPDQWVQNFRVDDIDKLVPYLRPLIAMLDASDIRNEYAGVSRCYIPGVGMKLQFKDSIGGMCFYYLGHTL